jgi:hypothetical protein
MQGKEENHAQFWLENLKEQNLVDLNTYSNVAPMKLFLHLESYLGN